MNLESIAGGLISATYLIPISVAFCLVATHGKYLPLWLPYVGLIGAYAAYYLGEVLRWPGIWAIVGGIGLSAILAPLVHTTLFRNHVERNEPYAALLRAIAITVFVEAGLELGTHGYAMTYSHFRPGGEFFISQLSQTVTGGDLLAISSAFTISPVLAIVLRRTWAGIAFRSVASNRNLAREYGIPVSWVDIALLTLCGALSGIGATMFGMKYDLSAQMLSEPTIKAAAVVVAFGAEWPERVTVGILLIGALEALTQSSPDFASFAPAIGYIFLIAALVIRYSGPKLLRRVQV